MKKQIKLNLITDGYLDSNVSILVDKECLGSEEGFDFFEDWSFEINEINEDEYDVYFAWGMCDGYLDSEALGVAFVMVNYFYDIELKLSGKTKKVTVITFEYECPSKSRAPDAETLILDEDKNIFRQSDKQVEIDAESWEEIYGIGDYHLGIFTKEEFEKLPDNYFKGFAS